MGSGGDACSVEGLFIACSITSRLEDMVEAPEDGNEIMVTPGKEWLLEVLVGLGGGWVGLGPGIDLGTPPEGTGGTCTLLEVHRTCWRKLLGQLNTLYPTPERPESTAIGWEKHEPLLRRYRKPGQVEGCSYAKWSYSTHSR